MRAAVRAALAVAVILTALPAASAAGRREASCAGLRATITGTGGADTLEGTPGGDVIAGRGGNDTIDGGGGDDVICGGSGADTLSGGLGDDRLKGGNGSDLILGGPGDDTLDGWYGDDRIEGGNGWDVITGHHGDDRIDGGRHGDDIDGGKGEDRVAGSRGIDRCRAEQTDFCEIVPLRSGDRGWAVEYLQRVLTDKKLYREPVDGVYDEQVAVAVATFHKVTGPGHPDKFTAVADWRADPPSERMNIRDWDDLLAFEPTPPKERTDQPRRVEVDIGHQVLYLIKHDEVDAIVHVSTGENPYNTPRTTRIPGGSYFYYKHPYDGWSPRPGGWSIYKFWAYRAGSGDYGVHGYPHVPYYPASHGCIRVHVWDADYLHERFFIGMPVHVWDR